MQTSPPPSAAPSLIETTRRAFGGDATMARDLAAVIGVYSVRIVVALLILAVTLWASKRLAALAHKAVDRLPHHHAADETLADFVSALVRYLVIAIGFIAVLQQIGVQATSVLAVLGAASLAVGLALQGTLGNVAAGVMIVLLRPYRVGDNVELNGRQGKVVDLDLFNTKVVDFDGLTLYLPNGKVFGEMIVNMSQSGHRRIELGFGVDYEDDLDTALELLLQCAKADRRVLAEPPPWARVTSLGDSAVNITLRCWANPADYTDTRFDLTKSIKEAIEANGLSFPYPHQVAIERVPHTTPLDASALPASGRRLQRGPAGPRD